MNINKLNICLNLKLIIVKYLVKQTMDSVFGLCGKDWVIIASDCAVNRSIFTLKHDEDKIV